MTKQSGKRQNPVNKRTSVPVIAAPESITAKRQFVLSFLFGFGILAVLNALVFGIVAHVEHANWQTFAFLTALLLSGVLSINRAVQCRVTGSAQ